VWRAIEAAAVAQMLPRAAAAAAPVAPPQPLGEAYDPQRYDATSGTYELASYRGGKAHPPLRRHADPLAGLRDLYQQVIDALNVLLNDQARVRFPTQGRSQARISLANERDEMAAERGRLGYLIDKPDLARMREHSLRTMLTLLTIIRPRVAALDREASVIANGRILDRAIAATFGRDDGVIDKDFLQSALVELGDVYLNLAGPTAAVRAVVAFDPAHPPVGAELLKVHQAWFRQYDVALHDAFDRLAFLDDYYRDPKVLAGIAMMRFAASRIEMIWEQLANVRPAGPTTPPAWPKLEEEHKPLEFYLPSARNHAGTMGYQMVQIAITIQNAERVYSVVKQVTVLPRSTQEVGPRQSREMTAWISAKVWHLQVEVTILRLWQNLPVARMILEQHRTVDRGDDATGWMLEVDALTSEFQEELNPARFPNDGIQQKVDGWETRVKTLYDEIAAAIKHEQMVHMAGWMVIGLVLTFGASFWLQAALQGSKLLLFVAEGVVLTGINVGIGAAQGQAVTVKGVAGEFALNVGLLGFGRLISLFRAGGEVAEQISRSRRLLTGLAEGTAMVTATTFGQMGLAALLDDQATKAGGETSTTQMLSVNFIFNTIGFLLGASLHKFMTPAGPGAPAIDPKALAVKLKTDLDITVTVDHATRMIDLANKTARFQADTQELAAAARRGPLSKDQYLIWQGKGELLAIELEDIPELAKILNKSVDPVAFKAMLGQLRAAIRAPFQSGVVLVLPEFAGLAQVGDSVTWTYDPARRGQEKAQEAVRARFENRPGTEVRPLADGGWEAVDHPEGRTLIQMLPASPAVAGLLSPPLRAMVQTEGGRNGANLVEGQSAVPELGTLLKQAAHGTGRPAVQQILEAVGRPGSGALTTGDDGAWRGLGDYLQQGGDPVRLAEVLKLRQGKVSAEANADHVRRVLTQMGGRDPTAVPKTRRLLAFSGEATQAGLAKVQEQAHVPGLEAMLESAAGTASDDVKVLLRSLRFLDTGDAEVWSGLENYLKHDGNLAILNRALGFRGTEAGPNRAARIKLAFKTMAHWQASVIHALEAYEQVHPSAVRKGRHYASLFYALPDVPVDPAAASVAGQSPQGQAAHPTGLTRQQADFLDRLLEDHEARGIPEPDMEAVQKELAQRDEAGRWQLLRSWRERLHLRVAHAEATRSGAFFPEEEDGAFDQGQGLHRVENRAMTTTEGAERVGALAGRDFAEKRLGLREAGWINPFEGNRSRFGTGFDDVMLDKNGVYWIVEYKGGKAGLAGDQMENSWVLRKLKQYRAEGGDLGVYWAEELEDALANGRLRGVMLQTKIVGRTAQPTEVVRTWPAYRR
jgi:hypothetical protein